MKSEPPTLPKVAAPATKAQIADAFRALFPASNAPRVFRGPGRVNLIGEHTDYNMGFVCPIALHLACTVAAAANSDGVLRIYSHNLDQLREFPIADLSNRQPARDWTDYVIGVAQQVLRLGHPIEGQNLYISSTVPVGAGMSSSAALEVSVALALLGDRKLPPIELALLARRAENLFVGTPCGIMDQYISVFGVEHAALKIDCRDLSYTRVPIPESVEILAVNSMVKHELGQSAYGERVRECAAAVEAIQRRHPEVSSLRDADLTMVNELSGNVPTVIVKRARHVVSEDLRVTEFVDAGSGGDRKRMGELFLASHRSLQHDYEVSCEELDFLVDLAVTLPGVWGARMTGGGFGGCTVNLVAPDHAAEFTQRITEAYSERYGLTPEVHACHPAAGASEL
ncbi:MAG: galactokinase [Ignavibacteriota bacterium]